MSRPAKNSTEVLVAAKWMIENIGWTQNYSAKYEDVNAKKPIAFCASGAISFVERKDDNVIILQEAYDRLGAEIPWNHIVMFNDDPDRTKEQVIAAFDRAIKRK